jgi:GNAT superfamily N-acetyltransferase
LLTSTTVYERPLDDGLILRSPRDERDLARLAAFNASVHGADVGTMTSSLALHHPDTRSDYWLYIEDEAKQQIVSTLVLIPWIWHYEDVTLKSGEMGIVATHEDYRNRGLIRKLDVRFKELLRNEGFDLSHIQGIPYFYRQFGYEYAITLNSAWTIELHEIPETAEAVPYSYRRATVTDIPILMRMYEENAATLDIRTVRSEQVWHFMFEHTADTAIAGETWLMLDAEQQPVGYWGISAHGFSNGLIVSESSRLSNVMAEALIRQLKQMAVERGKPNLRLNMPTNSDLVRIARCWGARDMGAYAWQILIADVARLLRKIAPVLERRLAGSVFAGLTHTACINLYKEAFELSFVQGKLTDVKAVGFREFSDIRIPPTLLTPLVLGYRSREELARCYPDVSIWGQAAALIDTLFPKMESFIYTNY